MYGNLLKSETTVAVLALAFIQSKSQILQIHKPSDIIHTSGFPAASLCEQR